jgi:acyl-coenzyme A synthetase/AMP-(fatty) acid ligase
MQRTHPWFHAATLPDKPAIIMADTGEEWTYRQMTERSNQLTRLLRNFGLGAGDALSIVMENRPALEFAAQLPRQENGKLYKRLLRERYWTGHATRIV